MTKEQKVKVRWMENENRKNIDAMERAQFIRELMEEMGWNQGEVAKKLQKSEGYISQHLKVLYGYKNVRDLLEKKKFLSLSQGSSTEQKMKRFQKGCVSLRGGIMREINKLDCG